MGEILALEDKKIIIDLGQDVKMIDGSITVDIVDSADIQCDIAKGLPFEDNSVDVVVSNHFLEHINFNDGMFVLKEIYRVLVAGGNVTMAIPDLYSAIKLYFDKKITHATLVDQLYDKDNYGQRHLCHYDFESLSSYMIAVGFKNVKRQFLGDGYLKEWMVYYKKYARNSMVVQSMLARTFQITGEKL